MHLQNFSLDDLIIIPHVRHPPPPLRHKFAQSLPIRLGEGDTILYLHTFFHFLKFSSLTSMIQTMAFQSKSTQPLCF